MTSRAKTVPKEVIKVGDILLFKDAETGYNKIVIISSPEIGGYLQSICLAARNPSYERHVRYYSVKYLMFKLIDAATPYGNIIRL